MPASSTLLRSTFDLTTTWSPDVVATELRKRMGASLYEGTTDFVGTWLDDTHAKLSLRTSPMGRQTNVAIAVATIEPAAPKGTRLHVELRLTTGASATAAVSLLFGVVLAVLAGDLSLIVPCLALGLAYPAMIALFWRRQRRELLQAVRDIYRNAPALPTSPGPAPETGIAYR